MLIEPEISTASVVLIGSFNPAIFSPAWFRHYGLVADEAIDDAEVTVIHPRVAQMQIGWFTLTVEKDKLQLLTSEAPYIRLNDLLQRVLGELLPHTPLKMVGINRDAHFNLGSQSLRDRIGHTLAPPAAWGDWAPKLQEGGELRRGGMRSITMSQMFVEDRKKGNIQATVEPSLKVANRSGVYIMINDHYEAVSEASEDAHSEILKFLGSRFDASVRESEHLMDQVLRLKDV